MREPKKAAKTKTARRRAVWLRGLNSSSHRPEAATSMRTLQLLSRQLKQSAITLKY
jgi:hypothetical protein